MSNDRVAPNPDRNPLDRENLLYPTGHLPLFEEFDAAVGLQGEEYLPLLKAAWYQAASLPIRRGTVSAGDIHDDLRVHLLVILTSGGGKREVRETLKNIAETALDLKYHNPASYHPEQFVGKVKQRKIEGETFYVPHRGFLDADLLTIDEAKDLLQNKGTMSATRRYLNTGLDSYPHNEVQKKRVDIPDQYKLSFKPDCNALVLGQPINIPARVVEVGLLRRFFMPYVRIEENPSPDRYAARLKQDGTSSVDAVGVGNQLADRVPDDEAPELELPPELHDRFTELHHLLVQQGKAHSTKGYNYTQMVDYTLQDRLLKLAGIQAAVHGRTAIEEKDLERAYVDMTEFLAVGLDFIHEKVTGRIDYGEGWGGAIDEETRQALEWLKEQDATTLESSYVPVQDYLEKIQEIAGVGEEAARKRYQKQKERGMVEYKQTGQRDTRVWLEVSFENQGGKGVKGYRADLDDDPYHSLAQRAGR